MALGDLDDAVFFNPATFHAAGTNSTRTMRRMANLLQVSSPFGRPMESIDRSALILSIYSDLIEAQVVDNRGRREVQSLIAASADGYAFPTNLDNDQPADGRASSAQADLLAQALAGRRTHDEPALRLAARVVPSVNPGVAGASCGT